MSRTEDQPKLSYSVAEFARLTSLSKAQTYIEIKAGRLQTRKAGRRTLVTAEEARRWVEALPAHQGTVHDDQGK